MEFVFIVPALLWLAFLPIPPHGAALGAFVVLSTGIVGAILVWWGLRSPTRVAWWGALVLAGAWSLNSTAMPTDVNNGVVLSYLFAAVPAIAQAIVLVAWLRGTSVMVSQKR